MPPATPIRYTLAPRVIAFHVRGGHAGVFGQDSDVRARLSEVNDREEIERRFKDVWDRLLEPALQRGTLLKKDEAKHRVLGAVHPNAQEKMANFFQTTSHSFREIVVEGAVFVARLWKADSICDQLWPAGAHRDNRRLSVHFPTNADHDLFIAVAKAEGRNADELAGELLLRYARGHLGSGL